MESLLEQKLNHAMFLCREKYLKIRLSHFSKKLDPDRRIPPEGLKDYVSDAQSKYKQEFRLDLENAFSGIQIIGQDTEMQYSARLPTTEFIGFSLIDSLENFSRGNDNWGISAFRMKDGIVEESIVVTYNGLVGVWSDNPDHTRVNNIPAAIYPQSITSIIPIDLNSSQEPQCRKYQNFLTDTRMMNGRYGTGGTITDVQLVLNGRVDAYVDSGFSDVRKLAALQLITEKAGGVVLDEFGNKVVWTKYRQNVIFARSYEVAETFFLPKNW